MSTSYVMQHARPLKIPTEETFHHTVNINFVFLCGFPGFFNLKDPFESVEKTKLKLQLSQEISTE